MPLRSSLLQSLPRLFVAAILLVLAACTGLAGEPPVVATLAPSPTAPPPDASASQLPAPDLINGARIFAERCASCHGLDGAGQGELVRSGEVPAMPSFLDDAHVRTQTPHAYYEIITNGNLEKLMPPWRDALTDAERWDLAYYAYLLRYDPPTLARGQAVFLQECAGCHGEDGRGEGSEMVSEGRLAGDLTALAEMSRFSDENFYYSLLEGVGEYMPAFADVLNEDELHAVMGYARTFVLRRTEAAPLPASTEEAAAGLISVRGRITNGTRGAALPEGLRVILRFGNLEAGLQTLETTSAADGTFTFADVPLRSDFEYISATYYNERPFLSAIVNGAALPAASEFAITLYELTEDPFSVRISAMDLIIESFTVPEVGTGLLLRQRVTYTNDSDRAYSTNQPAGGGRFATLLFQLPPGSVILNNPQDARYILAQQNYAIIDTAPVLPGENTLEAVYFLPYVDGAVIDQALTNAFNGPLTLYIIPPQLRPAGAAFELRGSNLVDGEMARVFYADFNLNAGDSLVFDLEGSLSTLVPAASADEPPAALVAVALAALLFLGSVAAAVYLMRRPPSPEQQIAVLVRQIAALDALHERGQINHDVYQRQRAELRARLLPLMQQSVSEETTHAPEENQP